MKKDPDEIYACPKCNNLIARDSLVIDKTYQLERYSDGKGSYLKMPKAPRITICPQCNNVFWFDNLNPIGKRPYRNAGKYKNVEKCTFLSIYEYISALDRKLFNSKEEETYLRIRMLRGFNDRVRNGETLFQNDIDKTQWEKNIYRLLDLLNVTNENRLLIAELFRYLGNFNRCIKTLYGSPIQQVDKKLDPDNVASQMVDHCKSKNQMVFEIGFVSLHLFKNRRSYDKQFKNPLAKPPVKRKKKLKALEPEILGAITKLFNQGFCLLNGFVNDNTNYLYHFEYVDNYRKQTTFKYIASDPADYEKAIQIFSQIISTEPKLTLPYEFRGIAYYKLRHYKEAIADYSTAISFNSNLDRLFYIRAIAKDEYENYYGAIDDYTKAIEQDPTNHVAFINRGSAKFKIHEPNGAINDYTQAIDIGFNDIRAFYNRGIARIAVKDYKGAIDDFSSALKIDNNDKSVIITLALTKRISNDYIGSITDYNRALELDPDSIEIYINRGIAKKEFGKYQDAIDDYNKALLLEPENALAFYNRGLAKHEITNYREAILDFNKALNIDPTHGLCYFNRGLARLKLKQNAEAQIDNNIASGLDPRNAYYYDLIFEKASKEEEPSVEK